MSQRNKKLESHLVLVKKKELVHQLRSLFHLRPHSIHLDNRPVLLSSSPQLAFPSGPSSEPSFLPWLSAAAQLSRPLAEPGWLLSQLPNRWSEHGNISQRQPNDIPGRCSTAPTFARCSLILFSRVSVFCTAKSQSSREPVGGNV